jgi:hypothetical protein
MSSTKRPKKKKTLGSCASPEEQSDLDCSVQPGPPPIVIQPLLEPDCNTEMLQGLTMQIHETQHIVEQLAGLGIAMRSYWSQADLDRRHRSRPPFRSAPASGHTNAFDANICAHLRVVRDFDVAVSTLPVSNSPPPEEPGAFTLRPRILVPTLLLQRYLVQDLNG